jgi:hypothetical protein
MSVDRAVGALAQLRRVRPTVTNARGGPAQSAGKLAAETSRKVAGMAGEDTPGVALVQRPGSTVAERAGAIADLGRGDACAR